MESVTFDQTVTLPAGVVRAGTPVPVETLLRTCARMRQARTRAAAPFPMTVKAATLGCSYANPDYRKAKIRTRVRGRATTSYQSLDQIGTFGISPLPLFDSDRQVITFTRMAVGIEGRTRRKYVHYFAYPASARGGAKPALYGVFIAKLGNGWLDFVYKLFMDNRRGDIFTAQEYTSIRGQARSSRPRRGLVYGRYILTMNGLEYVNENVPMLLRASKRSAGGRKVKGPASN